MSTSGRAPAAACEAWPVVRMGNPAATPLVLLHGFMQDAASWNTVAPVFAKTCHIAAPNMGAQGPQDASLDSFVHKLDNLVQKLSSTSKPVLVGYSMGGRIALEYAMSHTGSIGGLVLESAGLGPRTEAERAQIAASNEKHASAFEAAQSIGEAVDYWEALPLFATQDSLSKEQQAAMRAMRMRSRLEELPWVVRGAGAHTMHLESEYCAMLEKAGIPVLYAAGAKDEKYAALAQRLAQQGFNVKLFDCGHNVHFERSDAFVECVLDFLKGLQGEPSRGCERQEA